MEQEEISEDQVEDAKVVEERRHARQLCRERDAMQMMIRDTAAAETLSILAVLL